MLDFKGSTIWARQTIESDIFFYKPDKWFKVWFYIVNKVNWKDSKQFERGVSFINYKEIIEATNATKDQIDKFIRWGKKEQMLATRKTTRGMVITVLNYAKYQDAIKTKSDTKSETQAKRRRNRSDTIVETYKHINKLPTPNGETTKNMDTIELDELGEPIKSIPKKYINKSKLYSCLAVYYMGMQNKSGNALRYYPVLKEIVELYFKEYPNDTDKQAEKEIKGRMDVVNKHFKSINYSEWGLGKLAENWNKIIQWSSKLK